MLTAVVLFGGAMLTVVFVTTTETISPTCKPGLTVTSKVLVLAVPLDETLIGKVRPLKGGTIPPVSFSVTLPLLHGAPGPVDS
jgi:hypothetical protein